MVNVRSCCQNCVRASGYWPCVLRCLPACGDAATTAYAPRAEKGIPSTYLQPRSGISLYQDLEDDFGRDQILARPFPSWHLSVVYGLNASEGQSLPLSGATPDPCPKIRQSNHPAIAGPAQQYRECPCPNFSFPNFSFKEQPMPKNNVTDLITDQEMAFARLVLSGTMTDREAAQAVGLNPDAAAYTKSKPRVRAYMIEHHAAMQQQILAQEAEKLRRQEQRREQVLDRLWEIANLSSEMTRGSITGQVKAIQMIVAIEGMIPDRRAGSAKKNSVPAPIYPQPSPAPTQQEDDFGVSEPEATSGSAENVPRDPVPSRSTSADR